MQFDAGDRAQLHFEHADDALVDPCSTLKLAMLASGFIWGASDTNQGLSSQQLRVVASSWRVGDL